MQDFRGTELEIGDKIIISGGYAAGSGYLKEGYVAGFTPKMIKVSDYEDLKYPRTMLPARVCKA